MATRNELAVIRAARAGESGAQLTLGKLYLFGGEGLQKNFSTALYWFDRAAQRNEREAWMCIGAHIPFEVAVRAPDQLRLCHWYERAFEAGATHAGLAFARLVLQSDGAVVPAMRRKALLALEAAAHAGSADAQLLLAQQLGANRYLVPAQEATAANRTASDSSPSPSEMTALQWTIRAAENGVLEAQRGLASHAWVTSDHLTFLRWALPIARSIAQASSESVSAEPMHEQDALLLSRCARMLFLSETYDADEIERFYTLAAQAGDKEAQFWLGLWFAKMDAMGERISYPAGNCHYRKAIHWLTLAGEQGVADAWYALAKIYLKPNSGLSHLGWADAKRPLERASEAGHGAAQFELGVRAWRMRHDADGSDVYALYWLQKAAAQRNAEARELLQKIASNAVPAKWALMAQRHMTRHLANNYPFLTARIELAALFGLSRPEALLLDLNSAIRQHCLVVDVRSHYRRGKRRFILVQTDEEWRTLSRIGRLFADIECGPSGPEGNYQKRCYLFKKLFLRSDAEIENHG